MKSILSRLTGTDGQALLESAIALPIVIVLLMAILDAGAFLLVNQSVTSAADTLARQIEAEPTMTASAAQTMLAESYPDLPGASASITPATRQTEGLDGGYKVWDAKTGSFVSRPTEIGWDRREVTVTYEGRWTTPITILAANAASGTSTYTVRRTVVATNDATFEVW